MTGGVAKRNVEWLEDIERMARLLQHEDDSYTRGLGASSREAIESIDAVRACLNSAGDAMELMDVAVYNAYQLGMYSERLG